MFANIFHFHSFSFMYYAFLRALRRRLVIPRGSLWTRSTPANSNLWHFPRQISRERKIRQRKERQRKKDKNKLYNVVNFQTSSTKRLPTRVHQKSRDLSMFPGRSSRRHTTITYNREEVNDLNAHSTLGTSAAAARRYFLGFHSLKSRGNGCFGWRTILAIWNHLTLPSDITLRYISVTFILYIMRKM